MSTRNSRRVFTFSLTLLAGALLFLLLWTPLRIQYHRSRIKDSRSWYQAPTTLRGRLSTRWVRWCFAGRPDIGQQIELGKHHEDALVKMGYFARRTYSFTNDDRQSFMEAVRHAPLKDPLFFFAFGTNTSVEVLAHRNDFPKIKKMLEEYRGLSEP